MHTMRIFFMLLVFSTLFCSCKVNLEVQKIDNSLKRGSKFMQSKIDEIDPNLLSLLIWNNNRLNLGLKIDTGKLLKRFDGQDVPAVKLIRVKINNESDLQNYIASNPFIHSDELMYRSFNCNKIPINNKLYGDITMMTRGTEYDLSHALLFISLIKNNGCANNYYLDSIQNLCIYKIQKSMVEFPVFSDLNAEFTALLMYAGAFDKMDTQLLQNIIDIQKEDGSWVGENVKSYKPYELHTCFLSLWALGEWKKVILEKENNIKKKN